jgi:hypothetical protein
MMSLGFPMQPVHQGQGQVHSHSRRSRHGLRPVPGREGGLHPLQRKGEGKGKEAGSRATG